MAQQEFDQPALPGAKMPVDASASQTMQEGNRLLGQEFFQFVGGHCASQLKVTLILRQFLQYAAPQYRDGL